jgi:DNA-binding SARP family transcriptional activator
MKIIMYTGYLSIQDRKDDNYMKNRNSTEYIAIRTFGGLTFYRNNLPMAIQWDSQKARLLFCYLLITSDQWVHRNQLIELLWPGCNHEAGFKNFKTTLSRLRKSFNCKEHFNPILAQGDAYRINFEAISCDCGEFRANAVAGIRLMARGNTLDAKAHLEQVSDLYVAEFLPEEPADQFIGKARKELFELHRSCINLLRKIYESEERSDLLATLQTLAHFPTFQCT